MANAFSNFFITTTENLNIQEIEKGDVISNLKDTLPRNFSIIKIIPITEAETRSVIHYQKPEKSSGYGELTSKILKTCASLINHPLSFSYNSSLYMGIFGEPLKIAVVKPLYRKGDKTTMTNYRPVSLLTLFSKVFKKTMHSRLSYHLHADNILVMEQYGFM